MTIDIGEDTVAAFDGAHGGRRREAILLLRAASRLVSENATDEALENLVAMIPSAFPFPDQVLARIRLGEIVFGCPDLPENLPLLRAAFAGSRGLAGIVEVARRAPPTQAGAIEFLPEETDLLESLASMLGAWQLHREKSRQLRDAEQRVRAFFSNELDCVKVLDGERRLVEMNSVGLAMLGCRNPADLIGQRLDHYIHPDDLREYCQLHQRAMEGHTTRGRYRVIGRDGSARFLETINMPLSDGDGVKVLSVTSDRTPLVREEEKFRYLLDSSPDATLITDARGTIRIINRACESIFGYTRYELIGRPVEMLLPEHVRESHVRVRERYTKKPYIRPMGTGGMLKGRRKSGVEFPAEIALGPVHGEGELRICVTVRDLTGVREFEAALHEMASHVAVHTGQQYILELVKYLSSHFGLHIALVGFLDESGEHITSLAVARDGQPVPNMTYPLMGTPCAHVVRERPRFHEKDVQQLYPEDRWFRETGAAGYAGVPLYDHCGMVIGLVSAISKHPLPNVPGIESFFRLASARASAELDRLRQLEEIRESERRFELVERGTADGIWDVDMATRKVYYSPRVSELLGLDPSDLEDNPETFLSRVHPDDILAVRETRHAHLQHGAPFDVQYRIRHANGTYRWFRSRGHVVRGSDGQAIRFVGNLTDISEGKRHQLQLKAENAWLACFAEAAPLAELLQGIADSGRECFEGVELTLWMLDANSEIQSFPAEAMSRLDPVRLRALATGAALPSAPVKAHSGQWPWKPAGRQFESLFVETVSHEDVAERVVVALSYPQGLPRQRHERDFVASAARLIGVALAQLQQKTEIERQRRLFKNLFESSPEAMVILDRNDCVLDTNSRFTEVFQFTAEESRRRPLNDLIVPAEFAREAQTLSGTAMRGTNVSRDTFRRRKDGSLVPVSILGAPVTVSGTEAAYFAVYRDQSRLHEAAQRLEYQSQHDQLTGLPNRYAFERSLRHAMALSAQGQGSTGVLYFDLDQFKVINDTVGHGSGDKALQEVTHRLKPLIPAPHAFARLGGDEFAVLVVNGRLEDCEQMAQRIRDRLAQSPFEIADRLFTLTASFGVVAVEAGTSLDPHDVLSLADSASFIAKERGRNRVQVHDANEPGVARRREEMDWISRLNEALVDDRFKLHHQRIVPVNRNDDRDGNHYEILLRMVDLEGRMVPPGVFIPPAERFNLMPRIDRWVLERVFSRLGKQGREAQRNLVVAINISGNTLSDESLTEFVVGLFEQHAVLPSAICFEITETAAIGNFDDALRFIAAVRRLGCAVALDDFGSGLSSFRYLKEISPDYLKIDGSFVREITRSRTDYSMVEAINRVGKTMGVRTIAEFVEDDTILDALREIGVDDAQGYGVHRPELWRV